VPLPTKRAHTHTYCLFRCLVLSLKYKQQSLLLCNSPCPRICDATAAPVLVLQGLSYGTVCLCGAQAFLQTQPLSVDAMLRHNQSRNPYSAQDPMIELAAKCLVTRSVKIKSLPLAEGVVLSSVLGGLFFSNKVYHQRFCICLRHCCVHTCILTELCCVPIKQTHVSLTR
jgi:hypothetical protein